MKIPEGWKLDVDAQNKRFRLCVDVPTVTKSHAPAVVAVGNQCGPWIEFDDALSFMKKAGHDTAAEGGRFLKRIRGWFKKG